MRLLSDPIFNPWRDPNRLLSTLWDTEAWVPMFDIEDTDDAYILRGDLPGMAQKDIDVRIEDATLTVRGERKAVSRESAERTRRERPLGQFERTFRLPNEIDEARIKAAYVNGVLELTLPKLAPTAKSRLIPVG